MDVAKEIYRRAREIDGPLMGYLDVGVYDKLRKAMWHYPEAGGKRLRPVMAVAAADAVGGKGKKAMPFGCALEIIHNFTLVHDDVMDEDETRRGRPAVHVLFDVPTAIIAGDALFAVAFGTIAKTDVPDDRLRRLYQITSETVYLVAEGQQMDIDFESRTDVGVDEYMEMVEKKTAVLFACAAQGGAIIAGGSEKQIKDMGEYARLLGIGFQIWDDVLGLTADERVLGKPVGSDIRNGKRTLIAVHALEKLGAAGRKKNAAALKAFGNEKATEAQVKACVELFRKTGSIEHATNIALDYAEKAKRRLRSLKDSKDKQFLSELVDFAVGRSS
ncbi:MAG: polyprenyl synthetase family protein [Methanomassiliicoccales archaeon]|nr:polyprenyl synthetase family protein [Methanomassiliicoccales archaeon]